ncbi:hypothetical protein LINPERHAP1_LOCUS18426 [Linum perenne]
MRLFRSLCTPSIRGTKKRLFDDCSHDDFPSSFTKKHRITNPALESLQAEFPAMEAAVLELALEECGGDVDAAIHHLCRLSLQEEAEPKPDPPTSWAELLVAEMTKATSVDDARSRAGKLLEDLEKAVAEKDIGGMRKRVEVLGKENSLLKRAVVILYERQKDRNEKEAESVAVKKLVVILVEIEEDSRDSSGDRLSSGDRGDRLSSGDRGDRLSSGDRGDRLSVDATI